MQKQIVRLGKEDKLAEKQAILVPTKNYLIVENLRKQKMKEKQRADALAKENEELKKQLKELMQKKG